MNFLVQLIKGDVFQPPLSCKKNKLIKNNNFLLLKCSLFTTNNYISMNIQNIKSEFINNASLVYFHIF